MTITYKAEVFTYIVQNKNEIESIANQIGISKEALTGAVAEEYNSIKNLDTEHNILNNFGEGWSKTWNHQILLKDYNTVHLPENREKLLNPEWWNKIENPTLNDIGPGNIKLSTAIDLLNNYIIKNPNSDPLNIKSLADDYNLLARKLINPEDNTTFKFAGLMLKEGQDFYLANSPNAWRGFSQDYKDAVLVTYYNLGKERADDNLFAFKSFNRNSEYVPGSGSGGNDHLANLDMIKLALNASKFFVNEAGDLFLLDDFRKMTIRLSDISPILNQEKIKSLELTAKEADEITIYSLNTIFKLQTGSAADDQFIITKKHNIIDGGEGVDTISYINSAASINADLLAGNIIIGNKLAGDGTANMDIVLNIENVIGSNYGDVILGNTKTNIINGGNGNDEIDGDAGDDILNGEAGDDIINGDLGNDVIYGGEGFDKLDGGDGNDILDGGNSYDNYIFSGNFGKDIINNSGKRDSVNMDLIMIDNNFIVGEAKFLTNIGGNNIYKMTINDTEYHLRLVGDQLTIVSGSSDANSITINNFSKGDYRISLGAATTLTETQVNSYTNGEQRYSSIAGLKNGGFVVSWSSSRQDGKDYGIYMQRFDANGNKLGAETRVNTTTNYNQYDSSITALSNGNFVVSWSSDQEMSIVSSFPFWDYGIYMQRFDANGNKLGVETKVNSYSLNDQKDSSITALGNGGFAVSWTSQMQDRDGYGVYMQRFDANGNKLGSETLVNTTTQYNQYDSSITALSNGNFVVSWIMGIGYGDQVYMQRFGANGNKLGVETLVNTQTSRAKSEPSITALSNGNFVVSWKSDKEGVYLQRFDANGNKLGVETKVNTYAGYSQHDLSIATLSNGGFVVSWTSDNQDGSEYFGIYSAGIYMQRFDSSGNKLGAETRVNTYTTDNQIESSITAMSNGGFVVSWASEGQDGSEKGIYMQQFNSDGERVGEVNNAISGSAITSNFDINTLAHLSSEQINQIKGVIYTINQGSSFGEKITTLQNSDNNFVDAGGGDDDITTFAGNDVINAGSGNDKINAGNGNNIITGGTGNDTFIITPENTNIINNNHQTETIITDFEFTNSAEKIDLSAFANIRKFSDLIITEGSAIIHLPYGQTVRILNATPSDIKAENFIFKPNHNPISSLNNVEINEDNSAIIDVLKTSSDIDGDILQISNITDAAHGIVKIVFDAQNHQQIAYTPDLNYNGSDFFDYTISDGNGGFVTKTVNINVTSVNDAPISDSIIPNNSFKAGTSFSLTLPNGIFTDIDNNILTYSASLADGSVLPSWLSFNSLNNTFSGNIPSGSANIISVKVTASDGESSTSQTFNLNILSNIINGTSGNETIQGTANADEIYGKGGNDRIEGYAGNDVIYGEDGNDILIGWAGNDIIYGGKGDDYIEGALGADYIDGGDGVDGSDYWNSNVAMNIDLAKGTAYGINDATQNDILVNIESAYGSKYNDLIRGDDKKNTLEGRAGNDILTGNLGADILLGGAGNDIFNFSSLDDSKINAMDLIKDFTKGQDKIDLNDLGFDHVVNDGANTISENENTALHYHYDQKSNSTIIDNHNNDFAIKLSGLILLDQSDFIFGIL